MNIYAALLLPIASIGRYRTRFWAGNVIPNQPARDVWMANRRHDASSTVSPRTDCVATTATEHDNRIVAVYTIEFLYRYINMIVGR